MTDGTSVTDIFNRVWDRLEAEGDCDGRGGAEYERVHRAYTDVWLDETKPTLDDEWIADFIREHANVGSSADLSPMEIRANEKIEQQATLFGMVVATFLGAPEGDVTLLTHLWAAVEHLAKKYEIDAYEHCTTAVMMIAMSGMPVPHDLDARIERLKPKPRDAGFAPGYRGVPGYCPVCNGLEHDGDCR